MRNQGEGPADAAWEKYAKSEKPGGGDISHSIVARAVFAAGWNAALAWIPFRIQQFRELEEALNREIQDLKEERDVRAD